MSTACLGASELVRKEAAPLQATAGAGGLLARAVALQALPPPERRVLIAAGESSASLLPPTAPPALRAMLRRRQAAAAEAHLERALRAVASLSYAEVHQDPSLCVNSFSDSLLLILK